jgi:hypothetical protein
MDFSTLIPVVAIIAGTIIFLNIMKHGRRRSAPRDAEDDVPTARENIRLARENEDLRLTIGRLEERLGVLERIATDPAERTAREIESLR